MPCVKCEAMPNFHSFVQKGQTTNGVNIFYSKPSLAMEKRLTEEAIPNFLWHMDEASAKGQWIWLFDTAGLEKLEVPKLGLLKSFYQTVSQRYFGTLQAIYLMNINWKVGIIFDMLRPLLSKAIQERLINCKSPLQLVEKGIPAVTVQEVFVKGV